ncbi:hypothetical protein DL93DRAFT_2163185 [Clavulina sp. PMI_390]|nr:hypothetical protein DL93DRAFT_2163185 [Clavulina sp. PMI_390]
MQFWFSCSLLGVDTFLTVPSGLYRSCLSPSQQWGLFLVWRPTVRISAHFHSSSVSSPLIVNLKDNRIHVIGRQKAAADILVASIVVYSLSLRKKITYTGNGLLTSILALVEFSLFQFVPQLGAHSGFGLVLGRIYANSLLASLNLRGTWIQEAEVDAIDIAQNFTNYTDSREGRPTNKSINDGLFSSPISPLAGSHGGSLITKSISIE